ncbi:restriction endonuclease subunit S [Escherichia coli]|uniref:restriction endonuclease subunit S n=1 Tax=Escherichia coli TaxID=562 RepID=UPI001F132DAC|nr:restriction endonuclease subunit S [Escherichia coli]MCH6481414.1 restriction endonuclease subunit S [Escherichia coli]
MVPKGWSEHTLDDLALVERGKFSVRPRNDPRYYGGDMPFVQTGDVTSSGTYLKSFSQTLNENGIGVSKVFPKNTILITIAANIGDTAITTFEVACPDSVVAIQPYKHVADVYWLKKYLETRKTDLDAQSTQNAQKNINLQVLKPLLILTPPYAEQKKIAQILLAWDKAISVTEKLLANSQQQKKALMQQLLTGKKRLPDENGVSFSGAWKWLRAAELFKTISQKNNSEDEELLAVTQDLGVIPRSMLERRVVMPDGSTKGYKLVVPGNFIISLRSFQGGLEYSRYRGLVSPAYTVLTPIKKIVDEFYKQYYKSYDFIGHLAVAVIGIRDGKQISYEDFSFLKLPYPEIEEQQKIAAVLSAADAEISTLEKKLACLRDEKKALMQQLLTGKRRVKVDEAVAE